MTQNKIERYKKRQMLKKEQPKQLTIVPDPKSVQQFANSSVDESLLAGINSNIEKRYNINTEIAADASEAMQLLREIRGKFEEEQISCVIEECKGTVIDAIIKPFGLSSGLFKDKDGGNVTTVHNFKQGITATKDDENRYIGYKNSSEHFERKNYINSQLRNQRDQLLKQSGDLKDAYTGRTLPKDGRSNLDHVVSAHEIDKDAKNHLFLNLQERQALANSEQNLVMTDYRLNQSKSDLNLNEWLAKKKDGKTNAERFGVNVKEAKKINHTARRYQNKIQRRAQFKKQGGELLRTGVNEGIKMGVQQSVGLLLKELTEAIFHEIRDIFNNGFKSGRLDETFFTTVKRRLTTITQRVISKWKDVVKAFKDGVISGFLSNLVTFIINSFKTTSARVVRIIREGVFSLLRAIKTLLMPPPGMSIKEAAHESVKLIASAVVVSGGILLEEGLDKFIKSIPVLGAFSDYISPVIMGIITGMATTFVVFLLDKLDLFNVKAEERHSFVTNKLDQLIDFSVEESKMAYEVFKLPQIITSEA